MSIRRPRTPRDERLINMPDTFLDCRVDRHALTGQVIMQRWRYPDADVVERKIQCVRCLSFQVRQIVEWSTRGFEPGEMYRPTMYEYAKGYLNPVKGTGRIPGNAVRLEAARRWLDANPMPIKRHASN